jgi:hypothetical protein
MRITPNLVSWQWRTYPDAHHDRTNLAVHALLVPLFVAGLSAAVVAPFLGHPWVALGGLAAAFLSLGIQGSTHKREPQAPAPFLSPLDFAVRIVVEQFLTFPGWVLSGGFARAWKEGATR